MGVRRASDKIKAVYIGSVSQSATILEFISGQRPRADHIYTKMIDELNGLSILQLNQSKIQEILDEVTLNILNENQSSDRE